MSNLSRMEKALVTKGHMTMLSQIADSERIIKEYGLPYYCLQFFKQQNQYGMISEKELNQYADLLFWMEMCRLIEKSQKKNTTYEQYYEDYVDTSNLVIGMIVKDYKTMCRLLGEAETTGAAKIKQMENWKRYFDYEKIRYKNSFIIMEIYDEPISKAEKKYRNSMFVNEMKVLILKEVSKNEVNSQGNIIYLTSYSRLIRKLHILSRFFYEDTFDFFLARHSNLFSEDNIIWNYQVFKSNTFRKIKDSVKYALDALEKDDMLRVEGNYAIGEKHDNGDMIYHNASDNEIAYIIAAKKLIANKMGFRNSMDACLFNQSDFNRLLTAYYKAEYGWDVVYYQLKLIANQENIIKHISEYTALSDEHSVIDLTVTELMAYRNRYNDNLSAELKRQAENMKDAKKKSYLKRLQETKDFSGMDVETIDSLVKADEEPCIMRWGGNFPKIQNVLIDYLVCLNPDKTKEINTFIRDVRKELDIKSEEWIPELDFVE